MCEKCFVRTKNYTSRSQRFAVLASAALILNREDKLGPVLQKNFSVMKKKSVSIEPVKKLFSNSLRIFDGGENFILN